MKIVQVSPYAMDRPGGVQSHVRDLSNWLERQGHDVQIIAPPGKGGAPDVMTLGRVREISMHGTHFELSRASKSEIEGASMALFDWGADVVHLHTPWTPMLGWQVWKALELPTVATFHATLPEGGGFDPMTWFLGRAAKYFDERLEGIVVPSRAPQAQWEARGHDPVPKILAPAIDLSEWRDVRQGPRHSEDGPHVIYLGRLEERKGVQVLVEAWKEVSRRLPAARLTIAGKGSMEGALREAAQGMRSIRFLPPPDNEAARALVARADFFAAPATGGESFGLVLIEAMAAGTIPIAAENEGYATVLANGGETLLVPPGDPAALADRIVLLASDQQKALDLRTWAMARAETFDVAQVGPRYVALYQAAVDKHGASMPACDET